MPRTKDKPGTGRKQASQVKNGMEAPDAPEVLTLAEAANFLRVSEDDVLRLAAPQILPGRQIGSEWRFLKSALRRRHH